MRGVWLLLLGSSAGGLLGCLLTLLGRLTGGVLRLLGRSLRDLLGLSGYLSDLIGDPAQGSAALLLALLTPASQAANGVLHLLGRSLRDLLHLLLGLLDGLAHRVFHSRILSRLIHRTLYLRVGVDHLLDLRLSVALGKLLREPLELLAVVLDLALYAPHRLPEVVLCLLKVLFVLRLLLDGLRSFAHFVPFSISRF
jgi:hypothetical protein